MTTTLTQPITDSTSTFQDLLFTLAIPEIYRANAFQQLGLPITASIRELAKQKQIIDICLKTDAPLPKSIKKSIVKNNDLDPAIILEATQNLQNPLFRIVEEIFWFWPLELKNEGDDPSITSIFEGHPEHALAFWEKCLQKEKYCATAEHNLAVYHHIQALETYLGNGYSAEQSNEIHENNRTAFLHWGNALKLDQFWQVLTQRIKAISDPRLTNLTLEEIKPALTTSLTIIQARLIIFLAEKGQTAEAKKESGIISTFGFEKKSIETALDRALSVLSVRTNTLTKKMEEQVKNDPIKGSTFLKGFINQANAVITVLDLFKESPKIKTEIGDQIADSGIRSLDIFSNKVQDWEQSVEIAKSIQGFANSYSLKQKVADRIKQYDEAVKWNNQWCAKGYYALPAKLLNPLEKARTFSEQGEYLESIKSIMEIIKDENIRKSDEQRKVIDNSLAFALNMRANKELGKTSAKIEQTRTVIQKVVQKSKASDFRFQTTLTAVMAGTQQFMTSLNCMACGTPVTQYYVITFKTLKILLCSSCYSADQVEVQKLRDEMAETLQWGYRDLFVGYNLNTKNKRIEENLNSIKKIAIDCGIELKNIVVPSYVQTAPGSAAFRIEKSVSKPYKSSPPPIPFKPSTLPANKSKNSSNTACTIIGIIVLCIVLAILSRGCQ